MASIEDGQVDPAPGAAPAVPMTPRASPVVPGTMDTVKIDKFEELHDRLEPIPFDIGEFGDEEDFYQAALVATKWIATNGYYLSWNAWQTLTRELRDLYEDSAPAKNDPELPRK